MTKTVPTNVLTEAQVASLQDAWEDRGRKDAESLAARYPGVAHLGRLGYAIDVLGCGAEVELDKLAEAGHLTIASTPDAGEYETCEVELLSAWEDGLNERLAALTEERMAARCSPQARDAALRAYYTGEGPRPAWLDEALGADYDADHEDPLP